MASALLAAGYLPYCDSSSSEEEDDADGAERPSILSAVNIVHEVLFNVRVVRVQRDPATEPVRISLLKECKRIDKTAPKQLDELHALIYIRTAPAPCISEFAPAEVAVRK